MELTTITALSPLDGRYNKKLSNLSNLLSEYGLIKARVQVEIEWLIFLAKQPSIQEIKSFQSTQIDYLKSIYQNFSIQDALEIKEIESHTNHDVKAVEYFIKKKLKQVPEYNSYISFIHFACTSEDINNLSYSLLLQQVREEILIPNIDSLIDKLAEMAKKYSSIAMLARTHGQSASPTTMGKELINFADRIDIFLNKFKLINITGKLNGAVGNYNAHSFTYPNIDWPELSKLFVENLGLKFSQYTTQINPHDDIAEYCNSLAQINNILLDLSKDIWGYISLGYFEQEIKSGEVGSSTMPHKVNPIDFENAEGNLGLANSLLQFFSNKLPISRWQRDLSDSTVLRNLGTSFGYCLLAYKNLLQGLNKLKLNNNLLKSELNNHWEVLAEPIQTVMRRYGIDSAYEQLKELTRGEKLNQALLHEFISNQNLPKEVKQSLLDLKPDTYTGVASHLTEQWSKR